MELIPIKKTLEENSEFLKNPNCNESLPMSINFYNKVGYNPPWIGYYVKIGDQLVGSAGYKGKPRNGQIEIAYGTFEKFRQKGIGKQICKKLVELSLKTDPSIRITARTLPENNYSTKILQHNGFKFIGKIQDEEDGEVWEWEYKHTK
jgi:RimJ/RimL family protein N-acetyltransferase